VHRPYCRTSDLLSRKHSLLSESSWSPSVEMVELFEVDLEEETDEESNRFIGWGWIMELLGKGKLSVKIPIVQFWDILLLSVTYLEGELVRHLHSDGQYYRKSLRETLSPMKIISASHNSWDRIRRNFILSSLYVGRNKCFCRWSWKPKVTKNVSLERKRCHPMITQLKEGAASEWRPVYVDNLRQG